MTPLAHFILLMVIVSTTIVVVDFILKHFKTILYRIITGVGISTISTILTGNIEEGLGFGFFAFIILLLTNNQS